MATLYNMLSIKTCIELVYVIEKFPQIEIDRIFNLFENLRIYVTPFKTNDSKSKKVDIILEYLKSPSIKGPFGNSFQIDMLQYVVDNFYREKTDNDVARYYIKTGREIKIEDFFSEMHPKLSNTLLRDGYKIKGQVIKKLLPEEMEEAKSETELLSLLNKFNFIRSKGHLEQAVSNHSQGNWASANAQFRVFIESLLIEICKKILPVNTCETGNRAIKLLGLTANPPFLKSELNEIENSKCETPFVEGLWKRLHPEGNHPGLSDKDDCTFRYHLSIVFAHYLLKRLDSRL